MLDKTHAKLLKQIICKAFTWGGIQVDQLVFFWNQEGFPFR